MNGRTARQPRLWYGAAIVLLAWLMPTGAWSGEAFDAVGDTALYEQGNVFYALTTTFPFGWRALNTFVQVPLLVDAGSQWAVGDRVAIIASSSSVFAFNALLNVWRDASPPGGVTDITDVSAGDTVAGFSDGTAEYYVGYSVGNDVWVSGTTIGVVDDVLARGDVLLAVNDERVSAFSNQTAAWSDQLLPEAGETVRALGRIVAGVWTPQFLLAYEALSGTWSLLESESIEAGVGETLVQFRDDEPDDGFRFGAFSPFPTPGFATLPADSLPSILTADTLPNSRVGLYEGSAVGYSSRNDMFTTSVDLPGSVSALSGKKVGLVRVGGVYLGLSDSLGGDFADLSTVLVTQMRVGDRVALAFGPFSVHGYSSRTGTWSSLGLPVGESPEMSDAGGDVGVVATQRRILIFNAIDGQWRIFDIAGVGALDADGDVAVLSTGSRVYGYSASKDVFAEWPVANVTYLRAKGNTAAVFAPSELPGTPGVPGTLAAFSRWTGGWVSAPLSGLSTPTEGDNPVVGDNLVLAWGASDAQGFDSYLGLWQSLSVADILEGRAGRSVGIVRTAGTAHGFTVLGAPRSVELVSPLPGAETAYSAPLEFSWDGEGYATFDVMFSTVPSPLEGEKVAFPMVVGSNFSPTDLLWQQVLGVVARSKSTEPIYWTVVGKDLGLNPDYGDYWALRVTGMNPPEPIEPDGTSEEWNAPPFFSWTAGDYGGGQFRIRVSLSPDFPLGSNTFFLSPFIPDLTYQPLDDEWAQVVQMVGNGATVYWRVWGQAEGRPDRPSDAPKSFSLIIDPPMPTAPNNTTESPEAAPVFTWTAGDYEEFRLQVSNSPLFVEDRSIYLGGWVSNLFYQPLPNEWQAVVNAFGLGRVYWRVWGRAAGLAERPSDVVLSFRIGPSGWTKLTRTYPSLLAGKDASLYAFRDGVLRRTRGGATLVKFFYGVLPAGAALAEQDPHARTAGWMLLAPSVSLAERVAGR